MRAPYFDCDISCSLDLQIKTASFVRGQASGFWLGSGWFTTRLKPSSFFTLGECARSVGPGWSKHEVPTTSTVYK